MAEGVNFAKDYQKDLYNKKKFIEKFIKNKNSFSHTKKTLIIKKM